MGIQGNPGWPFTCVYSQEASESLMRKKSISCPYICVVPGVAVMWMVRFPSKIVKELNQRIRELQLIVWIFNQIGLLSPRASRSRNYQKFYTSSMILLFIVVVNTNIANKGRCNLLNTCYMPGVVLDCLYMISFDPHAASMKNYDY